MTPNDDQIEGRVDQATGGAKEQAGRDLGNDRLETEGQIERAEGQVTEGLGDAKADVADAVHDAKRTLDR